jgi:exodeoxyribonuclease V alpha subunit
MTTTSTPHGKEDLLELTGSIENIIYQNEENGYTVCELAASDDDLVTMVGIMPFLGVGETVKALGRWELHASFGRQFKVEYYEKQLPSDEAAMLKYLASGAIKGVGPVLAQRIIDQFGEDAFDVIENHPDWLSDIDGITKKKAQKISERFRETFGVRSVMMFCRDFFGPATAVKVYKKWGGGAVDVIKANPYALCESIHGIGFETADRIAADHLTTVREKIAKLKKLEHELERIVSHCDGHSIEDCYVIRALSNHDLCEHEH